MGKNFRDSSGLLSLRMTKRGAQNDGALYGHVEEQGDETSQFNVIFVRTKVTKSRRDKRSS